MKIAICISGHLRTFESTFESLEKLFNSYDCDVFISTWRNLGNAFAYHAHYKDGADKSDEMVDIERVKKIYRPISIDMENADTHPTSLNIKEWYKDKKTQSGAQVSQVMIMLYKIWHCNQLKKQHEESNAFKYDITIRLRFDVFIKKINVEAGLERVQFIPGHMGLNDIMFFGPNTHMDDISDLYTIMSPDIPFSEFINVKHLWHTHVMNNNIPFNVSYDIFDYNRHTHQGIFDIRGNKIG